LALSRLGFRCLGFGYHSTGWTCLVLTTHLVEGSPSCTKTWPRTFQWIGSHQRLCPHKGCGQTLLTYQCIGIAAAASVWKKNQSNNTLANTGRCSRFDYTSQPTVTADKHTPKQHMHCDSLAGLHIQQQTIGQCDYLLFVLSIPQYLT
jgi:hypothetical protein